MNPVTVLILFPAVNLIKENKAGSSVQRAARISELLEFSPLFLVQKLPRNTVCSSSRVAFLFPLPPPAQPLPSILN